MMALSDADMLEFDWVPLDEHGHTRLQGRWLDTVVCELLVTVPADVVRPEADPLPPSEVRRGQILEIRALWSDGSVVGAEQAIVAVAVNYARQHRFAAVVATLTAGAPSVTAATDLAHDHDAVASGTGATPSGSREAQTYAELGFFPAPERSGPAARVWLDLR